jgi:hypothetical protein
MSLITVHLRWHDIDREQYQRLARAIPDDAALPAGCLSRQVRYRGSVVMAVEVWDSEKAGNRLDHLVTAVRAVGVEQQPQSAMFSVPQMFAVGYRRAVPRPPSIPIQPGPPAVEQMAATTVR